MAPASETVKLKPPAKQAKRRLSAAESNSNKAKAANNARQRNHRQRKLYDVRINELRHSQGEAYTRGENRQALLCYFEHLHNLTRGSATVPTRNDAIQHVASILVRGDRVLRDVIQHYERYSEILVSDPQNRGWAVSLSLPDLSCRPGFSQVGVQV